MSINKVIAVGNLTRDPEIKEFESGSKVCKFSIAVNEKYKDKENTYFFDCQVWGVQAENLVKYQGKGSKVLVDGSLKQETWESDGQKRSKIIINAFKVEYLTPKSKSNYEPVDDLVDDLVDEDAEESIYDGDDDTDIPF